MTAIHHTATSGVCLCGKVRYQVHGPLSMMIHCHCSMCRKHHGASFATFVGAPLMGFRWISGADHVAAYDSSQKGQRSFCGSCGSVTPTLSKEMDMAICPAGNLLGDLDIRPESHFFAGSKPPWFAIADGLPQHEEFPQEFGITGVTRPEIETRPGIAEGSCLCGKTAYEATGAPLRMVHCHCSRCRRGRSAAHATNVVYRVDDFRFTRGEVDVVNYKVPEAQHFATAFCRHCGGAAPRISSARGIVIVPAGTLDTDPGVRPQCHIFVGSKANWFEITDALPQFEAAPT